MTDGNLARGSAERLLLMLKLIAAGPATFSLSNLAQRAELPASSVHRLLQVLLRAGLVERGPGQSYRTGRELIALGTQILGRFDLARSARPILRELVSEWQETAVLCLYRPARQRGLIAEIELTPHPLRFAIDKGVEIELPWGSLGRAILAFLPPNEIATILREARDGPLTGRPKPGREEFEHILEQVRTNQVSRFYDPDFDLSGIAAPIFGADRLILGCIGITMPSNRYNLHAKDDLVTAVREAAEELSRQAAQSSAET